MPVMFFLLSINEGYSPIFLFTDVNIFLSGILLSTQVTDLHISIIYN
jgi:hypothetical protein